MNPHFLSHAWTDTTAVRDTLFPLGAPAYGIYTNWILLIQNQHITLAQWHVTQAERSPWSLKTIFLHTCTVPVFFIYLLCSLWGRLKGGTIMCVGKVIVDSVLRYEGNVIKSTREIWWDGWLVDRVYPLKYKLYFIAVPLAKFNLGGTHWKRKTGKRKHYRAKWAREWHSLREDTVIEISWGRL